MPILNIHMISDLQDPRELLSLSQEQLLEAGRSVAHGMPEGEVLWASTVVP